MHLEFYGAADGVTGSLHRIHCNEVDVLLDCGLFQGRRAETNKRNRNLPRWATAARALALSHAHLDHSGSIPLLAKRGFAGNVYCTPPTRDLCSVMLRDAAMIQQQDAVYLNKQQRKQGKSSQIEPLYLVEDAHNAVSQMISLPLRRPLPVAPGVTLTFHNAGHVLGSALVQLDLLERGRKFRLLYTGDLGRKELPLLERPDMVKDVDLLILESTYGDRLHSGIESVDDKLCEIVTSTIERRGRVYIPTFALERAQEVLFAMKRLHGRGLLPQVPIYIDSPLAIAITEIYKLHPEGLDSSVRNRILDRDDPFAPPGLHYVSDIQSSRVLQQSGEPCIVIAGSGMCEGGRILHHFGTGLSQPKNSVVIVGFMAEHTLGRRLVEGIRRVKVFGVERDVRAAVHSLNGLSAHADREGLVGFVKQLSRKGQLRRVALVHGEEEPRRALQEALLEIGTPEVIQARMGERVEF